MISPTPPIPAQDSHVPVLLQEVVEGLAIVPGETLVDGTFGAGGYTKALFGAGAGRVIGFDRDPDAIANGPSLVPPPPQTGPSAPPRKCPTTVQAASSCPR